MANRWGNNENRERLLFSWAPKSLWTVTAATKLKDACSLVEKLWLNEQCIKKQRHYFADKGPYSQSYGFSSSHVQMWELDYKEGWALKNWCFQTVVLERTLESPLDSKEIKPVNHKGKQPWIFIGRTDAEAPIFGHLWEELTHWKRPWCWERLKVGGEGDDRGGDVCMASVKMSLSKLQEMVKVRQAWRVAVHGAAMSWTWQCNWTTTKMLYIHIMKYYLTINREEVMIYATMWMTWKYTMWKK